MHKKRLLVLDDEPHIANLVKMSLKHKFDVEDAYSGEEAYEKIKVWRPDVILLDIMMPGVDGFTVCKTLKENPETEDIPIIILSARTQMMDKFKAIDLGADDYVTKPFDPLELENRIESNLILHKLEKQM
jgi:two-component system alkaline phosphatase synthesis response regulator PhoP